mmetsp:Transcript_8376/g.18786  ORF Transcript_8376/g.18786 Transcript_8376/m.18786 type:complete len:148 (-) Transcript_8376:643-1086(-)
MLRGERGIHQLKGRGSMMFRHTITSAHTSQRSSIWPICPQTSNARKDVVWLDPFLLGLLNAVDACEYQTGAQAYIPCHDDVSVKSISKHHDALTFYLQPAAHSSRKLRTRLAKRERRLPKRFGSSNSRGCAVCAHRLYRRNNAAIAR